MGRPSITGPTIVVAIEGDLLIWTDGFLSGTNPEHVAEARRLSLMEMDVMLTPYGPEIPASLESITFPERALAAMMGVLNGKARILEAPQEVLDLLPIEDDFSDESVVRRSWPLGTDLKPAAPDSNKE